LTLILKKLKVELDLELYMLSV